MGLRLFRHDYSGQATKDKVAVTWLILQRMPLVRCEIEIIRQVFVANLLRFAEMIAVRCVVHLKADETNFFERHPALQDLLDRVLMA